MDRQIDRSIDRWRKEKDICYIIYIYIYIYINR